MLKYLLKILLILPHLFLELNIQNIQYENGWISKESLSESYIFMTFL